MLESFFVSSKESKEAIRRLQAYEYILWTWFQEQPRLFLKKSIEPGDITRLFNEAQRRGLTIASEEIEARLKTSFPVIYALLKIHRLRLDVCHIKVHDRFLNHRLAMPDNMKRWTNFIESITLLKKNPPAGF